MMIMEISGSALQIIFGTIKFLIPRQVADLLGHTTSEITELYYVKRDMTKLNGITDGLEI